MNHSCPRSRSVLRNLDFRVVDVEIVDVIVRDDVGDHFLLLTLPVRPIALLIYVSCLVLRLHFGVLVLINDFVHSPLIFCVFRIFARIFLVVRRRRLIVKIEVSLFFCFFCWRSFFIDNLVSFGVFKEV